MKYILTTVLVLVAITAVAQDYHGNHPADAIRAMRAAEKAKAEKAVEIEVTPIPDVLPNLDIQKTIDDITKMQTDLAELKKNLTALKEYLGKNPNIDWTPPHPK